VQPFWAALQAGEFIADAAVQRVPCLRNLKGRRPPSLGVRLTG
jgi:hypothetical protein